MLRRITCESSIAQTCMESLQGRNDMRHSPVVESEAQSHLALLQRAKRLTAMEQLLLEVR